MKILEAVQSKLGRCARCMRSSFLIASTAWSVAVGFMFIAPSVAPGVTTNWLIGASCAAAFALTLLWIAHLAAYGVRLVDGREVRPEAPGSRRAFLTRYGQIVAGAALMSSVAPLAGATIISGAASARAPTAGGRLLADAQDDRYRRICKSNCGVARAANMAGCPFGPDGDDCRAQVEQAFHDCMETCS